MCAGATDFAIDRFEEGVVGRPCLHKSMEPIVDIVGCHVFVKRGKVGDDGLAVFTSEAPGGKAKSRRSRAEQGAEIEINVKAAMVTRCAIEERLVDHVDCKGGQTGSSEGKIDPATSAVIGFK